MYHNRKKVSECRQDNNHLSIIKDNRLKYKKIIPDS